MNLFPERNARGASTFFRGKELLGLVLFIAIAAVGWPILIVQMRRQSVTPPAAPKVAPDPRPIKPDDGPAFQAIRDKTPAEFRELTAYAELLKRVRETPPEKLRSDARRDLFFTHFWERPAAYRGVPVHFEGTLKKTLAYEVKPELSPAGKLSEAWFITEESRGFPYVVVVEEPPPGFTIGPEFNEPIRVDAYFFKLLAYRAGDTPRAAPMFIGRISLPNASAARPAGTPSPVPAAAPFWKNPAVLAVVALFAYVCVRFAFQLRKLFKPIVVRVPTENRTAPETSFTLPPDRPSEEDVASFLTRLEQGDEPDEKPSA